MIHSLETFFNPSSIAVIGASEKLNSVGVTRYTVSPNKTAEFSIAVADDWQGKGIGSTLLINLLNVGKIKGVKLLQGVILANNQNMKKLEMNMGFSIKPDIDKNLIIADEKNV